MDFSSVTKYIPSDVKKSREGIHSGNYKQALDPGGFFLGSDPVQPGIGGPAKDTSKLVQDPTTGLYYDPTTGTSYTDPAGQTPVTNPNVAQQVAANYQTSRAFLSQLGQYGQQYNDTFAQEQQLSQHLSDVINGTGGPSVAQTQLQQGLGQVRQEQDSMASGGSGVNGALARMNAMQNAGAAQAATNQAGAVLRAQEIDQATGRQVGLLGNQANQASGMYQTNTAAGRDFAQLAEGGQEALQKLTSADAQASSDRRDKNKQSAGNAIAMISDEREKEHVEPADGAMGDFLDKLAGFSFDYKDEDDGKGQRVGVMAQDAQKSAVGRSMVLGGKRLKLDVPNAVGAALAAVAYLKKRMDARA